MAYLMCARTHHLRSPLFDVQEPRYQELTAQLSVDCSLHKAEEL